jgi:hypothetical protein
MQIIAILLLFGLIAGGIYLWVRKQRAGLLAKHKKLVESSNLLDSSGNVSSEAFDRIVGQSNDSNVSNSQVSAADQAESSDHELDSDDSVSEQPDKSAASDEPPGGSVETSGSTASANGSSTVTVVDPTISAGARKFQQAVPRLQELCEKLLLTWREATDANGAYEKARRARSQAHDEISYSLTMSRLRSLLQSSPTAELGFGTFLDKGKNLYAATLTSGYKRADTYAAAVTTPAQAKAAWDALTAALQQYPESFLRTLPNNLAAVGLAAYQLKNVSKNSIENLLSEASSIRSLEGEIKSEAQTQAPECSDEETKVNKAAAAKVARDLIGRQITLLQAYLAADKARDDLSSLYNDLEHYQWSRFTPPQKPTPEEVMRYLVSVEDWVSESLSTKRQIVAKKLELARLMAELKTLASEWQGAHKAVSARLTDFYQEDDIVLELALSANSRLIAAAVQSLEKSVASLEAEHPPFKIAAEVTVVSSSDDQAIKAARAGARTLGFALAQAVVADNKLEQLRTNQPYDSSSQPKVDRNVGFARYLNQYTHFLKSQDSHAVKHKRWEDEKEVVNAAREARYEKLRLASKATHQLAISSAKSLSSASADELRIVVAMLDKLVVLNPYE